MRRLALAAALLASSCQPAYAQTVCGTRAGLLDQLAGKWQEAPVGMGLTAYGSVLEVFASADGATWTLLVTHPGGYACVVATGERWEAVARVALGPEL